MACLVVRESGRAVRVGRAFLSLCVVLQRRSSSKELGLIVRNQESRKPTSRDVGEEQTSSHQGMNGFPLSTGMVLFSAVTKPAGQAVKAGLALFSFLPHSCWD